MAWEVEYTDEFEEWWIGLDEEEQIDVDAAVGLLEEKALIATPIQFGCQRDRVRHNKGVENST
jgi:hypothetical protein